MKPHVHTWADGFGLWHARVPRTRSEPSVVAAAEIRAALARREGKDFAPSSVRVERDPIHDTEIGVAFRERV